jgi:hypothetical protein
VIHAIPGPVKADVFLREARWAVDVYESAVMEHKDDLEGQKEYLKYAHGMRYWREHRGGQFPRNKKGVIDTARVNGLMPKTMPRGGEPLAQAHWLLWSEPMPRLTAVYRTVWTDILNEEVTDLPVRVR